MDSIYSLPERRDRVVASLAAIAGGTKEIVRLNKDSIISEHHVNVSFSQVFGGAPNTFVASEVGRLIDSVRLVVSGPQGGELFACDGIALPIHSRLYENQVVPTVTFGTPTVGNFAFELHYANDEAKTDMMSALDGESAAQVSLELTFSSVSTGVLSGGTTPGAITFGVEVLSCDYNPLAFVDETGDLMPEYTGIASSRHFVRQNNATATASGKQEILLEVGNLTRNLMLIAETAAGALSDTLITDVSLVVGGVERRVGTWTAFKSLAASKLGVDDTGVCVLEWGDDARGWFNLIGAQQARLVMTFSDAGNVRCVQDYTS